ncbi:MAG: hypothetical protein IJQ21_04365 [Lachnospiraceae bacterium]|nr:hypothetical protein [Lachnospiraceae bacterium]
MDKRSFREEELNIRCFYLRLLQRIWVLPVAACVCALCAYLLYGAVTRVTQPALYEAKVQFYLHFVENATDDKVYDHYNAYTWNDLIQSDPVQVLIRECAENAISVSSYQEGGAFIEETGRENMPEVCLRMYGEGTLTLTALQPSDIRILWITVTSEEADCAAWFARTVSRALVLYGEENEVFRSIEVLQEEAPARVTYPERAKTAAVTGGVLGLIAAVFALLILHLLDDAIYVPEDAEKRYGLPVVAVLPREGAEKETPALLREEAERCFESLASAGKKHVLLNAGTTEEERSGADIELLEVRYGKQNGTLTVHVLSQARARGGEVAGIVLTGADMAFLKRYYRL